MWGLALGESALGIAMAGAAAFFSGRQTWVYTSYLPGGSPAKFSGTPDKGPLHTRKHAQRCYTTGPTRTVPALVQSNWFGRLLRYAMGG